MSKWLPLPKYEHLYEISNEGEVRNVVTGKELSTALKGNYVVCNLRINKKLHILNVTKEVSNLFGSAQGAKVIPVSKVVVKQDDTVYLYSPTKLDLLLNHVFS